MKPSDIIKKYGIRAQKKLGQNFLVDFNIKSKIISALNIDSTDTILEIGPGYGALTKEVLNLASEVYAVERDPKLCVVLNDEFQGVSKLNIIHSDILKISISDFAKGNKLKVLGNLPYYITSKILFFLIEQREFVSEAVLTMQREVADRILAEPGSKEYGRLTVGIRFFADAEKLFDIKPQCFYPVPDVISSVIKIKFDKQINNAVDSDLFLGLVKVLFQERRKSVLNGLKLLKNPLLDKEDRVLILEKAGVDINKRAEHLSIDEFCSIVKEIDEVCK